MPNQVPNSRRTQAAGYECYHFGRTSGEEHRFSDRTDQRQSKFPSLLDAGVARVRRSTFSPKAPRTKTTWHSWFRWSASGSRKNGRITPSVSWRSNTMQVSLKLEARIG